MGILVDSNLTVMRGSNLSVLQHDNVALEDYLETLTAPMIGLVPYGTRMEFRAEARDHIERQIERLRAEAVGEEEATRQAIESYGSSGQICDAFLAEWFNGRSQNLIFRRFGHANYIAFGRFAAAQALYTIILDLRVFLPSGAAYALPLTPAEARRLFPTPLPLPELNSTTLLLLVLPIIAPMIAGYLTGVAAPVRPAQAVYQAMMPILIYSFVVGALMLPMTEGLLFALFQVCFWIPVGMLFANIGAAMSTRKRCRVGGAL